MLIKEVEGFITNNKLIFEKHRLNVSISNDCVIVNKTRKLKSTTLYISIKDGSVESMKKRIDNFVNKPISYV